MSCSHFCLIGFLAMLFLGIEVVPASAQCRIVRGGYYSQPSYQSFSYGHYNPGYQVQYHQPQHYNYYAQTYVAPVVKKDYVVQKVVAQEIAVAPLIVTVPVVSHAMPIQSYGASHYYSVQETYQQRAAIRDVIRDELRAFMSSQQQYQKAPVTPGPAPSTLPKPEPGPAPAPSTKKVTDLGRDTTTPKELADQVLKAYKETGCMVCHGDTATLKGDLRLAYKDGDVYTLAKQTPERRWVVYGQASTGVMPPAARNDAAKAMKQESLPAILRWVLQTND